MNKSTEDVYIFILWEQARKFQNMIFDKISKNFTILDVYEIRWSQKHFSNNLRRFYGPGKLGNPEIKMQMCGTGSFLLIIVNDPNPRFDKRRTSLGLELVNVNLFDIKIELRKTTNTAYAIHSSITRKETNDDITMLLGKNLEQITNDITNEWNGKFKKLDQDIVGADGWKNFEDLSFVLNSTVNYVILRNFENLSGELKNYTNNDVDLISSDFLKIPYILNGGKSSFNNIFPHTVKIANEKISFDIGYPEDGNYDVKWQKHILNNKIFHNGFYIPSKYDHFYSYFYHIIFHRKKLYDIDIQKLKFLSMDLKINLSEKILSDYNESQLFLNNFLKKSGYRHTNSLSYRIIHLRPFELFRISILLWRVHGPKFLLESIKGKILRNL